MKINNFIIVSALLAGFFQVVFLYSAQQQFRGRVESITYPHRKLQKS